MVRFVSIITIQNGVVNDSVTLSSASEELSQVAEARFLAICREFGPIATEEESDLIEDGYYDIPSGGSVCLHWLDVETVTPLIPDNWKRHNVSVEVSLEVCADPELDFEEVESDVLAEVDYHFEYAAPQIVVTNYNFKD